MAKEKTFCFVGKIARVVITLTGAKYSHQLLLTLSEGLAKTMLTSSNIDQIIGEINHLLRFAENSFAQMMGFDPNWRGKKGSKKKLLNIIWESSDTALPVEKDVAKERARFLSNLSRSVRELKFYKPGLVR